MSGPGPRRRRWARGLTCTAAFGALLAAGVSACVEIGTGPNDAAAIELAPFASPSVVVGDTLRDVDGRVVPVVAIVRNIRGEIIADAPVRFLYADFARDSALVIDSTTGFLRALRRSTGSGGESRIAARFGSTLQVVRTIIVTTRPDTMGVTNSVADTLVTSLPDTAALNSNPNISEPLSAIVRHIEGTTPTPVNAWLVRFRVVDPANPTNDSSAAVFLVNNAGRPSVIDTTDASGLASRRIRVRAARFPAAGTLMDTVEVEVTTTYRGAPVLGAPDTIRVPVRRGAAAP